jgi:hypothetical protein
MIFHQNNITSDDPLFKGRDQTINEAFANNFNLWFEDQRTGKAHGGGISTCETIRSSSPVISLATQQPPVLEGPLSFLWSPWIVRHHCFDIDSPAIAIHRSHRLSNPLQSLSLFNYNINDHPLATTIRRIASQSNTTAPSSFSPRYLSVCDYSTHRTTSPRTNHNSPTIRNPPFIHSTLLNFSLSSPLFLIPIKPTVFRTCDGFAGSFS